MSILEYGESIETKGKWIITKKILMGKKILLVFHLYWKNCTNLWTNIKVHMNSENFISILHKMGDGIGIRCNNFWHRNIILKVFWYIFPNDHEPSDICLPFQIEVTKWLEHDK
jgi:hypothetical protein